VLAKHVIQVFFVPDTTNKTQKVVIPGKRWIVEVKNVVPKRKSLISLMRFFLSPPRWLNQEYHRPMKFHTCTTTTMKKSRISKNQEHNGKKQNDGPHNVNQMLFLWNCEEYPQCVKIWSFEWNFDFHWSFVWNILNVWKYGHLSKNLTFIGHLCEISSMCEIWSFEWNILNVWKYDHFSENLTMSCVLFLI
jgi:hypothetical protein